MCDEPTSIAHLSACVGQCQTPMLPFVCFAIETRGLCSCHSAWTRGPMHRFFATNPDPQVRMRPAVSAHATFTAPPMRSSPHMELHLCGVAASHTGGSSDWTPRRHMAGWRFRRHFAMGILSNNDRQRRGHSEVSEARGSCKT